ncbi:olfactory receptor [Escherichia phage EK99P-1]|uniref:Olfactory receptor n=1 Tax=Escherichia phage EK99P-1 TaxID=1527514 RepID=A0A076YLB2_9CAUD|nr:olfactory receptor [Escherichia phage EK99P-1]AIK68740.1 olfactory receptor [Escherichia phage EK99P-1]
MLSEIYAHQDNPGNATSEILASATSLYQSATDAAGGLNLIGPDGINHVFPEVGAGLNLALTDHDNIAAVDSVSTKQAGTH